MSQDQRTPLADVVYVLVAVGVPYVRALAAGQERSVALDSLKRPDWRIDSARNDLLRAFA